MIFHYYENLNSCMDDYFFFIFIYFLIHLMVNLYLIFIKYHIYLKFLVLNYNYFSKYLNNSLNLFFNFAYLKADYLYISISI